MWLVTMYDREGQPISRPMKYKSRDLRRYINSVPPDQIQVYTEGREVTIILGRRDGYGKETPS